MRTPHPTHDIRRPSGIFIFGVTALVAVTGCQSTGPGGSQPSAGGTALSGMGEPDAVLWVMGISCPS